MMADQIGKCDENTTWLSSNTSSTKEMDNFVDEKVQVSETVIIANNFELQDNMKWHDRIEYTILDNIKIELPSSKGQYNVINDYVKIQDGIDANNIKIEVDNGLLYCENCQAYYADYCIECGMLVHVLNRNAPDNSDNRTQDEFPNDILEIKHMLGQCAILALKVIPEGVKFGPFSGLCRTECAWRVKGGKFVFDNDISHFLNWMQYINPARNNFEGNLIVVQWGDFLYYRSTRQIRPGEELLVYFGEDFRDSLNGNVEMDFIPNTEHLITDIFGCTFCCLGFSSKSYLVKHKTICVGDAGSNFSIKDLTQCRFCKIHFAQKEYSEHHFAYCSARNVRSIFPQAQNPSTLSNLTLPSIQYESACIERKRSAQTLSNQITTLNGSKTRRSPSYKCELCNYRTKYKADLKKHTNKQHYGVKRFKCGICYRRFEAKEYLRLHVENTHNSDGLKEDPVQFRCNYENIYIKVEKSNLHCQCRLRTKHKQSLIRHVKTKHSREFYYECDSCEFKTKSKYRLESHIKSIHLKEFDFKCDSCEFGTNKKYRLNVHIKTIHLRKFDFKCNSCKYKTNRKNNFLNHIKSQHLKELNFKCDSCEFKTNLKWCLETHIKSKHLKEFDFKCDSCEFRTNYNQELKRHMKSKHLKEFDFKCDSCEFKTNCKSYLKSHIKSKHLKEFDFKCGLCEFKTNYKCNLENHIKSKHLKEFNFKCDLCEFKTKRKGHLKSHIKSKHLKEFDFKCGLCEFKTNYKCKLENHIKSKHL